MIYTLHDNSNEVACLDLSPALSFQPKLSAAAWAHVVVLSDKSVSREGGYRFSDRDIILLYIIPPSNFMLLSDTAINNLYDTGLESVNHLGHHP